jgi:site-specific recombinase XerD
MAYYPKNIGCAVLKECKRRRLSPRTAKTYNYCIDRFLKTCDKPIQHISKKDVRIFLEKMSDKGLSANSLNTYHMAIRFLFTQVLEKRMWINIKYSKTHKKLPTVLTKEEVTKLIWNTPNHKHKMMIALMYSAGLRVSELINLKVKDLELKRGFGYVRNGKGGKDRIFVLSKRLTPILQQVITNNQLSNEDYLFKSSRGRKYSTRSLQKIIKNSSKKAGINKRVHPHTLRHSYATHLIDNKYAVTDVQAMLGHKSPETSLVYVHSSDTEFIKVKTPFDEL